MLEKHLGYLFNKLNKGNASILEEVVHLKFLHTFLIKFSVFFKKDIIEFDPDDFCKFPKYKQYKTNQNEAVSEVDKRLGIFNNYILSNYYKAKALKKISEENLNRLNETLKIKDFIVVGDKKFHKLIQSIGNDFDHDTIDYIDILKLKDYLIQRKTEKVKYRNFSFYLIIEAKIAEKMYKELYTLKNEFALVLYLIIYIKNIKTKFHK